MNKKICAFLISFMLILSSVGLIQVAVGAIETPVSKSLTEAELQRELDTMYLKIVGLFMNVTVIDSQAAISGDAAKTDIAGFNYTGRFTSGNLTFDVRSFEQQVKMRKGVTLTSEYEINGPNCYILTREVNTTVGDLITTERTNNLRVSNSSGSYYLDSHAEWRTSAKTLKTISGFAQCEQNLYSPVGLYNISVTPTDGTPILTTTCPDGNRVTSSTPDSTQLFNNDGTVKPLQNKGTMNSQIAVTPMSFEFNPNAGDHGFVDVGVAYKTEGGSTFRSQLDYYYWVTSWQGNVVDFVVACITSRLATEAGIAILGTAVGAALFVIGTASSYWAATIDPYDVCVLYFENEHKYYDVAGIQIPLLYTFEIGFYTNYRWDGIQRIYTGWYYYPFYMLCVGHQLTPADVMAWRHGTRWSLDPPSVYTLNLQAYDASTGSYVANVPIRLEGQWVPSSSTVSIPAGDHSIAGCDPVSGAFNYFSNGSYTWGGYSTVITISGDTTITAYYWYIPSVCLTVSAWTMAWQPVCTEVYINGQMVGYTDPYTGGFSTYLPISRYEVYSSMYAYHPSYGYTMPLMSGPGNYWLTSDMTVDMTYYG